MERLTIKKRFEHFRPGEETTALCVDGYIEIVENDEPYPCKKFHYYIVGEAVDKLATYEDLEEQGLLLRLPCKVGDEFWEMNTALSEACVYSRVAHSLQHIVYCMERLGKTTFLTKEEAEAALAKMKGE